MATDAQVAGKAADTAAGSATDSSAYAVDASGVRKRFYEKEARRHVQALDDVSLRVRAGALTALVGPDGAGKTTFLRLTAGLMHPDGGTLRVLGLDAARQPQAIQNRISYMPQRFGLYEDLSVQENLDLYADLHGVPQAERRQRYDRLLDMTDLARFTARPAGKLSGGMKQKLGLACTLVRSPDLLLLDEPTVGVDPLSRRELWEIVQQLVEAEGLSVLMTTAYLDEAERCGEVYVLHEGQVLAAGQPQDISRHARDRCFVVAPKDGRPARELQADLLDRKDAVIDAVPHGGEVRLILRQDADAGRLGLAAADLRPVDARLEDGFMVLLRTRVGGTDKGAGASNVDAAQGSGAGIGAGSTTSVAPAPKDAAAGAGNGNGSGRGNGNGSGDRNGNGSAIEVRDLVRKFGDFTAVDRTTFSVARGEIFGLLGPNGAGKTTTFRMLCGLLPASSGYAQVAGLDMRKARAQARRRIGYVSQKFALYGNLSAYENLRFFGGAYGLFGRRLHERMSEVASQFELADLLKMPAGHLPGGVKQRLAMAVGLLHEPEILFLDEPTSGADPLARRAFWRRITALAETGTTIVITTHFMEEAEYCDRIVIQDAGKLLALGTPAEVRAQAGETADHKLDMEQAFIGIVEQGRAQRQGADVQATAATPDRDRTQGDQPPPGPPAAPSIPEASS
ncbi:MULTISPECIES: ATP-binding cassette domain-containing protein [unclassified Achromobacter]|uniref:ATP-binding cassette domain-containing protein n=1 Tax=unclassified Achromobacter TaxID=2626865 RepID=UPI000B518468|nr:MULTISPECIES: ATP-binding cassette domain-containing protein [unclassified Achromobacter]OWT74799.1 ABC transporter ATP-binding protein [Achromobacter sp. HZ34]OWT79266.1 ABC transporter ATP-binding protein [Achromobacter sp. HZ28]